MVTFLTNEDRDDLQGQLDEVKDFNINKQGKMIVVNDVSTLEHDIFVKLTSDTITDFSNVSVTRYCKNLIKSLYDVANNTTKSETISGVKFEYRNDKNIKVTGTSTATADINNTLTELVLPVGSYILSCRFSKNNGGFSIVCTNESGTNEITLTDGSNTNNVIKSSVLTVTETEKYIVKAVVEKDTSFSTALYCGRLQLEVGIEVSDYETAVPQTVYADGKGYIIGLTSVSPNMTLIADNSNVVINVGYKQDEYFKYGLPILDITGDTSGMSKDNKILNLDCVFNYIYNGEKTTKSDKCSMKWQGNSSLSYPKKNYTITFDNGFEAVKGWGTRTKYCLKANYVDHSHARNIVSAKLWGQIVKLRKSQNTTLNALVNGGAVDGFPIVIRLNGEFHGLYTFNIPKDELLFGMDKASTDQQAFVCAENPQSDQTRFKAVGVYFEDADKDQDGIISDKEKMDFELEFRSNSFAESEIKESLNNLIAQTNDALSKPTEQLESHALNNLIDWDSAIDYYIFTALVGGWDMIAKNYILATYNGTKWFFSAYDMDTIYGLYTHGKTFREANNSPTINDLASGHRLFQVIYNKKTADLVARYKELRADIMSEANLEYMFNNFCSQVPSVVYNNDVKTWPTIPSTSVNNVNQILNWYRNKVAVLDKQIADLETLTI